jgi:hypothetical protein
MLRAIIAAYLLFIFAYAVSAKDNGQWAQYSLKERQWFKDQRQPGTGASCCDDADGEQVEEDIRNGEYWIRSDKTAGLWLRVPPEVVIKGPNMFGRPVAWFRWTDGTPKIFCYAPGVLS